MNIDGLFKQLDHSEEFALSIIVRCGRKSGDTGGARQAYSMYNYPEQQHPGLRKPGKSFTKICPSEAIYCSKFNMAQRLKEGTQFRSCRQAIRSMGAIRQGQPGIFWLRSIFNQGDCYTLEELQKVGPTDLLQAILSYMSGIDNRKDHSLPSSMIYATKELLETDKTIFEPHFIGPHWWQFNRERLHDTMHDPN